MADDFEKAASMLTARLNVLVIVALAALVLVPIGYIYSRGGFSMGENVAAGGGYVLVLTCREVCSIRMKEGNTTSIGWIFLEGAGLSLNVTGGGTTVSLGRGLWSPGDRVHIVLKAQGKTVDLGTVTVTRNGLQIDDYVLLATYLAVLVVASILAVPRLNAYLNRVTGRIPPKI